MNMHGTNEIVSNQSDVNEIKTLIKDLSENESNDNAQPKADNPPERQKKEKKTKPKKKRDPKASSRHNKEKTDKEMDEPSRGPDNDQDEVSLKNENSPNELTKSQEALRNPLGSDENKEKENIENLKAGNII